MNLDELLVENVRRRVAQQRAWGRVQGVAFLLCGIALTVAVFNSLGRTERQAQIVRTFSPHPPPPQLLAQLMDRRSYVIGYATGALTMLAFFGGIVLWLTGVGLIISPRRKDLLLLRQWDEAKAAV